ncbi:ABC transporter substrate-binding protein [Paraburkholderia solisilvae]|uniref:Periplasmic dipeptide transport protein n=1 Tax=Paraburkholderia solisilvae TaxID=624376 RepID=A0A6J5E9V5_9BURK|nr:ABC transporter substrate-binding protein [Paraburkholderia solisilvae]CAB3763143.1 Periplasmic dipeptide transport protein [Paraburkholderia solisilvae]
MVVTARVALLRGRVRRTACLLGVLAGMIGGGTAHASPADTLVYCSEGSPESLNPQRMLSGTARNATATTIYDRLVDFRPGTTEVVPALAERWSISADQKTYVFHLRRGVKFHRTAFFTPGRDFNADDVLFSLNRQWKIDHPYHRVGGGNYQYFQGMGMDQLIVSAARVDAYTVRIVLSRPDAPFLADLAMPFMSILSAEYGAQLLAQGRPEDLDSEPIGTGPYAFRSYLKDSVIRYDAHPQYWRGKPAIAHLVFAITPNASVRMQKVLRGECQISVAPPPADLPALRTQKGLVLQAQDGLNIGYLAMNVEKPPFNHVLVRRAVAHALNRQAYIDAIFDGNAKPAINPYPPSLWSYTDQVRTYPYDPAKARELLAEAGYKTGFSTTLWTLPVSRPYNPNGRTMGEMMQADLARVGIKVDLVTYDWPTYLNKIRRGEHDMAQLGWSGDNGDPDNFLYTLFSCDAVTRGSNNARYCRRDFNALITEARATSDIQVRSRLYGRALAMLADDEPIVPLAHATVFRLLSARVSGYVMNPFDIDYFADLSLNDL